MLNKIVLMIEQDMSQAKKIVEFFQQNNFHNKIEVVQNKGEAMEYLFRIGKYTGKPNHETPGLILLDLPTDRTPQVQILKPLHLYLRTAEIPIIILTSSDEQEKEIADYDLGPVGFVRKPLDFIRFVEVIQRMGLRWKDR